MVAAKTNQLTVLQNTINLVSAYGYYGTSIADIAASCGLNKSSLFHYTKSKACLVTEAIALYLRQFSKEVILQFHENAPPSAQLLEPELQLASEYIFEFYRARNFKCLWGMLALEIGDTIPEIRENLYAFYEMITNFIYTLLKNFHDSKKAKLLTIDYISQIQGALTLIRLHESEKVLVRACQRLNSFQ